VPGNVSQQYYDKEGAEAYDIWFRAVLPCPAMDIVGAEVWCEDIGA